MTETGTAPRWDLTPIFPSLDDRAFTDALESIFANVDRLGALYDELGVRDVEPRDPTDADVTALDDVLNATNQVQTELRPISAYLHGLVTTDSRNERAMALTVELQTRTAALGPLSKRLGAWLAALGVGKLVAHSDAAAEHAFALEKAATDARVPDGRGGGVTRRRARAVGRARVAAPPRRRVLAARRRDRARRRCGRTSADGVGPRARDTSRRCASPRRVRRRTGHVGGRSGAARGGAQRCQGRARRS